MKFGIFLPKNIQAKITFTVKREISLHGFNIFSVIMLILGEEPINSGPKISAITPPIKALGIWYFFKAGMKNLIISLTKPITRAKKSAFMYTFIRLEKKKQQNCQGKLLLIIKI